MNLKQWNGLNEESPDHFYHILPQFHTFVLPTATTEKKLSIDISIIISLATVPRTGYASNSSNIMHYS